MRGLRGYPARYEATRRSVSGPSFAGASFLARDPGKDPATSASRQTPPGLALERGRQARRYGRYAAWHNKCFRLIIPEMLVALLSIFGASFGAGYGGREMTSSRRRRSYRRSMP